MIIFARPMASRVLLIRCHKCTISRAILRSNRLNFIQGEKNQSCLSRVTGIIMLSDNLTRFKTMRLFHESSLLIGASKYFCIFDLVFKSLRI